MSLTIICALFGLDAFSVLIMKSRVNFIGSSRGFANHSAFEAS